MNHPKITKALERYTVEAFNRDAASLLTANPRCRIVLGLLGGASTGRYGFAHSAGRVYPRYAVRYVRGKGIVGISQHSGPYLCIAL